MPEVYKHKAPTVLIGPRRDKIESKIQTTVLCTKKVRSVQVMLRKYLIDWNISNYDNPSHSLFDHLPDEIINNICEFNSPGITNWFDNLPDEIIDHIHEPNILKCLKDIQSLNNTLTNQELFIISCGRIDCGQKIVYNKCVKYLITSCNYNIHQIQRILTVMPLLYVETPKMPSRPTGGLCCHQKHFLEHVFKHGLQLNYGRYGEHFDRIVKPIGRYNYCYVSREDTIIAFIIYGFKYEFCMAKSSKFEFLARKIKRVSKIAIDKFQITNGILASDYDLR